MKRYISTFIVILVFVAIILAIIISSNNTKIENSDTETQITTSFTEKVTNKTITLEFAFGKRTGKYTGETNAKGLPNGKGSYKSINSDGTTWYYEGDWVNGHFEGTGTTKWNTGESYTGNYKEDYANGQGTYIFDDGKKAVGTFCQGNLFGKATLYFTDGSYLKGDFTSFKNAKGTFYDIDGYEYEAVLTNDELTKKSEFDFFDDKKRQDKYTVLYESYKYTELKEYIDKYIKENNPSPIDSAYSILDLIEPLIKYEDNWNISHDDFDDASILTFKNVDEINESRCIDISIKGTENNTTLGFVKNDWLFFDSIRISADSNVIYNGSFASYNIQRDTLGGRTIKESIKCSFSEEEVNEIIKSNNVKMRFNNKDTNEYYEYKLNNDDIIAIYCSVYLQKNNRDLSNLLYDYNNND